jgi:hypothetical protein
LQPISLSKPMAKPVQLDNEVWNSLDLPPMEAESRLFLIKYINDLVNIDSNNLENLKRTFIRIADSSDIPDKAVVKACALVVSDLVAQFWEIRVTESNIHFRPPRTNEVSGQIEKQIVQSQELLRRDEQITKPSVTKFIRSMESIRLYKSNFVSIFSLMRDGIELSEKLRNIDDKFDLNGIIEPYVTIIERGSICPHTGIHLMDIWRYFRLTWSNQYSSVPGRNLMFLIRDKAAKNHPVIGIGSLCSAVVQLKHRDKWIGWETDQLVEELKENPNIKTINWISRMLDNAISEIYVSDFIESGEISRYRIKVPNNEAIENLLTLSNIAKKKHQRFARQKDFKNSNSIDSTSKKYWRARSKTHLFTSKRALTLATLLEARMLLNHYFSTYGKIEGLERLLDSGRGLRSIRKIIKKIRSDKVGIAIADINVCGAIAPYNLLHGGKLVSAIAVSPDVIEAYRKKYANAVSEIASAMAGRPIVRNPDLAFLCTTSLYGRNSAQYNRINIPASVFSKGSETIIRYRKLGRSRSYGTSQFSDSTVQALVDVIRQSSRGQRVNSIFGEGVNPKLRKVRDGLEILGFPADELLMHGRERIIYGIALIENLRDYLLGIQQRPKYIISPDKQGDLSTLTKWWVERWGSKRIKQDITLAELEKHNYVQPIQHGARVIIPTTVDDEQLALDFI